jgi:hypothetical protein
MKPYMAFSRNDGPEEGAILVIANRAKDARLLAWRSGDCINVDDWLDLGVRRVDMDNLALADQMKLVANIPHTVFSPAGCEICEYWGQGITEDNLCCRCNEYPGDKLIRLLTSQSSRPAADGGSVEAGSKPSTV